MRRLPVWIVSCLLIGTLAGQLSADEPLFQYPYAIQDIYDADESCWRGMDANSMYPVQVVPQRWLVGPPPSPLSGVTFPQDHWVDLRFRGPIADGSGHDVLVLESGQRGEQALVFLLGPQGQEYLLGLAEALNTGLQEVSTIGFDLNGLSLPFEPRSMRIVALDWGGGSPGFDIASVRCRVSSPCVPTASGPFPLDGAVGVAGDVVLSWAPGCDADRHVVYFGPSYAQVAEASSRIREPSQWQMEPTFDPVPLELGRTYWWRVDEINDLAPDSPQRGEVWQFTVDQCAVIDDFESYASRIPGPVGAWDVSWNAGLSVQVCAGPAYHGCPQVQQCAQSLAMDYSDENIVYAEAGRDFDPPQDWLSTGAAALELHFRGSGATPDASQMYLMISDGQADFVLAYSGDLGDITDPNWHVWRIDLSQVTTVNLENVVRLAIGVLPDPAGPGQGGTRILYLDNIRLCSSRCLQEYRPNEDFNGDCRVNRVDLEEMASNWLATAEQTLQIKEPYGPLLWYAFDGDIRDRVGYWHGLCLGNPTFVDGVFGGQAIHFDGERDCVALTGASELFEHCREAITIAFWQRGDDSNHLNDTICCSDYVYGVQNPSIAINLGCWRSPGRYNWDCGYPWSFENRLSGSHRDKAEWMGRWNHWVFTKDTNVGEGAERGRMQIFLNGRLYASRTGAVSLIEEVSSLDIGMGWYGGYDGSLDDFQIYNYALTQEEAAYLATHGTGVSYQPLATSADLNGDERIDGADLALLAQHWLDESLWP